jgi:hypothetical protein
MQRTLVIYFFVLAAPDATGRITKAWRYQEMFDKADLVAIARVVTTKDTNERSTLGPFHVIGVTTDFNAHLIVKGNKSIKAFQLHHYKFASEAENETIANGPNLIRFSFEHPAFLLFLTKEADGRYAPVTGQEDPAVYSVLELGGSAD